MGENLGGYSLNSDNLRYTSMVPQIKEPRVASGLIHPGLTLLDYVGCLGSKCDEPKNDPIFFGSSQQILVGHLRTGILSHLRT